MARARNIKPALFKNELLGVADPLLTILFQSLWCLADREGRLEDRPLRIKAETFPYRENIDINGYLTVLQRMGFIARYTANGIAVIQVVKFKEHQAPHNTEKASVLPEQCSNSLISLSSESLTVNQPLLVGEVTEAKRPDSLIPDSLNLIPDSLIPDTGLQKKTIVEQKQLDPVPDIFSYWQKVMSMPRAALDDKRKAVIKRALKNYTPVDICKAIRGCSKSPFHMGENDRKTKYNGLHLILRCAEYIDRFMEFDSGEATQANETIEERNARITAQFLGDPIDDYNTIEMEA